MLWRVFLASALLGVLAPHAAWGHGFGLSLSGNQISASSESSPDGNPNLFFDSFDYTDPSNPTGKLFSNEGNAFADTGFPNGTTYSFTVVSPLLYANGSGPAVPTYVDPTPGHTHGTPQDTSVSLAFYDRNPGYPTSGTTTTAYGNTSPVAGFAILANLDGHEMNHYLSNWAGGNPGQGDGVYGFGFTITATLPTGASITSSILVDSFATPNFVDVDQSVQTLAAQEIYTAAAVPEPSTLLLAGLGIVGVSLAAARRRRAASR